MSNEKEMIETTLKRFGVTRAKTGTPQLVFEFESGHIYYQTVSTENQVEFAKKVVNIFGYDGELRDLLKNENLLDKEKVVRLTVEEYEDDHGKTRKKVAYVNDPDDSYQVNYLAPKDAFEILKSIGLTNFKKQNQESNSNLENKTNQKQATQPPPKKENKTNQKQQQPHQNTDDFDDIPF